jgi:hypothetical protein
MVNTKSLLMRSTSALSILALTAVALVPVAFSSVANAGIPGNRSITMETSAPGAVDAIYSVQFDTDSAGGSYNLAGLVIEFCEESPILGDAPCTTPTGFTLDDANLVIASQVGVTDWAVDGNSDANTLILTSTLAPSLAQGTTVSFDLGDGGTNGVTNPTDVNVNGTFYARIATYTSAAGAQGYLTADPANVAAPQDAGGIALSTASELVVTAKVAERLTFCVYTDVNCAAGGTDVSLGDDNGILDPNGPFVDKNAKFDISTNAAGDAVVVIKGDTLANGTPTIDAIGGVATGSNAGNEQFGFCLYESTANGLTPEAPYNNGNCTTTTQTAGTAGTGGNGTAQFAFDTTASTSASGDLIATKPAGNTSTAVLAMIGNISNVTEAGIYTTTLTFIATGTY